MHRIRNAQQHEVQRERQVVREHVGRTRAEEHEVEREHRRTDRGAERLVSRPIEEVVLGSYRR